MPFSFSTIEPNQIGRVTAWDIPFTEWMGLRASQGFNDTLGKAFSNASEDFWWDDNLPIDPKELNEMYGIEGQLEFDKPMSYPRARLIHERKRKEIERMAYLESASHSAFSIKAAAGLGAALVGGMAHPVDLGLSFIPFIGSEKAAAGIARLGGSMATQRLYRGAITEEALGRARIPFHRVTGAIIDGTVNQALMEIPIAIQKHNDKSIYGLQDSVFNVALGGLFTGAIKSLALGLERAARLWNKLDPRVKDAVLTDQIHSKVTGEPEQFAKYVGMDDATIRAKVEEEIRAKHPFVAKEESVAFKQGDRVVLPEQNIEATVVKSEDGKLEVVTDDGKTLAIKDGEKVSLVETKQDIGTRLPENLEVIAQKEARGIELTPEERETVEALIDPETPDAHAEYQRRVGEVEQQLDKPRAVEETRTANIQNNLEALRAEHEKKLKGLIDEETRKAIASARKAVPPVDPEIVKTHSFKKVPDDATIRAVEEDADTWLNDALTIATNEKERADLEAELKTAMKNLEQNAVSAEKAIDQLIPCITKRAKS